MLKRGSLVTGETKVTNSKGPLHMDSFVGAVFSGTPQLHRTQMKLISTARMNKALLQILHY